MVLFASIALTLCVRARCSSIQLQQTYFLFWFGSAFARAWFGDRNCFELMYQRYDNDYTGAGFLSLSLEQGHSPYTSNDKSIASCLTALRTESIMHCVTPQKKSYLPYSQKSVWDSHSCALRHRLWYEMWSATAPSSSTSAATMITQG
jgi:hypothetical protein